MKNTKELISKTFVSLVVAKKTYNITVTDICNKLDISRPTFYRYFKDRYEIIEYIYYVNTTKPVHNLVINNISNKEVIECWFNSFYNLKEYYTIIVREHGQNSLFETSITNLTEFYRDALSKAYTDPDKLEYVAFKLASSQIMMVKKWLFEGAKVSPKNLASYFLEGFNF